jgi:hypothetical protein
MACAEHSPRGARGGARQTATGSGPPNRATAWEPKREFEAATLACRAQTAEQPIAANQKIFLPKALGGFIMMKSD